MKANYRLFDLNGDKFVFSITKKRFFKTNEATFETLSSFQEKDIKSLNIPREYKYLFKDVNIEKRNINAIKEDYISRLNKGDFLLTLEITRNCNLDCHYCINGGGYYGFPQKTDSTISIKIVRQIINQLKPIINKSQNLIVAFFGGEPLLEVDIIRDIIREFKQNKVNVSLYTITTNLTICNEQAINMINDNNIAVNVSLDGYSKVHDYNRVFYDNKGSYEKVYKNLVYLAENIENSSRISIANTITPATRLNKIEQYYNNNPLFTSEVREKKIPYENIKCNYVIDKENNFFDIIYNNELQSQFYSEFDDYLDNLAENIFQSFEKKKFGISESLWFDGLIRLHSMYGIENLDISPLQGLCFPGANGIFVTTKGDYKICNMCNFSDCAYSIGNVTKGLDIDKCWQLFNLSSDIKISSCSKCWASFLCKTCIFTMAQPSKNDLDESYMNTTFCDTQRNLIYKEMQAYLEIMLNHSDKMDMLFLNHDPIYVRRLKKMLNMILM